MIAKRRRDDDHDRDARLAWSISALDRQKQLPKLERLLMKRPQQEKQTVEQQRGMLEILSQLYGGKLRKTRLKKKPRDTPRAE